MLEVTISEENFDHIFRFTTFRSEKSNVSKFVNIFQSIEEYVLTHAIVLKEYFKPRLLGTYFITLTVVVQKNRFTYLPSPLDRLLSDTRA